MWKSHHSKWGWGEMGKSDICATITWQKSGKVSVKGNFCVSILQRHIINTIPTTVTDGKILWKQFHKEKLGKVISYLLLRKTLPAILPNIKRPNPWTLFHQVNLKNNNSLFYQLNPNSIILKLNQYKHELLTSMNYFHDSFHSLT